MGRNNYPAIGPRTSLVANREVRRALRETTPSFGIRRPLERECCDDVLDVTFDLQQEGDIPDEERFELRDQLAVTLLSQRTISRQLMRGVVAGYNLGRTRAQLTRDRACSERDEPLTVARGDVRIFKGRVLYAVIESARLSEEVDAIHASLAIAGLKGTAKYDVPHVPHLTLGEATKGHRLSETEQRHMIHTVDEGLPHEVTVDPWETYPFDLFEY